MYRDINSILDAQQSIRPAVLTANTDGQSVDLRGSDGALVAITIGAVTGSPNATTAVTLEESDNGSSWTDVADADILGEEPVTFAANTAYQFGYKGTARYIRVTYTKGGETNAAIAAMVVRGYLAIAPTEAPRSNAAPAYSGT